MCATSFLSRPALLVVFSCALFSTALGQGENRTLPVYQDTGNPQKDAADYTQRKQAWIKANPEAYQTIGGQVEAVPNNPVPNPPMTHTVSAGYLTNLPKEKEVVPTSVNPNIQQKEEMLSMSAIPLLQNTPTTLPANFPQLQNTGNTSKDEADLARAKAEWAESHPNEHQIYLQGIAASIPVSYATTATISKADYLALSVEQQIQVKNNPKTYIIKEPESVKGKELMQAEVIANTTEHTDEAFNPNPNPNVQSIIKVTEEDIKQSSPSKIKYMEAHPEAYDMSGVK